MCPYDNIIIAYGYTITKFVTILLICCCELSNLSICISTVVFKGISTTGVRKSAGIFIICPYNNITTAYGYTTTKSVMFLLICCCELSNLSICISTVVFKGISTAGVRKSVRIFIICPYNNIITVMDTLQPNLSYFCLSSAMSLAFCVQLSLISFLKT